MKSLIVPIKIISDNIRRTISVLMLTAALLFALIIIPGITESADAAAISEDDMTIIMFYDDYLDIGEMGTIGEISDQNVTSGKVRMAMDSESGTLSNSLTENDDAVIEVNGNILHAVGVGSADIQIGEESYHVMVNPAKISLFLVIGQSNAQGAEGDFDHSIACENGTAYFTGYNFSVPDRIYSSIPLCLAGSDRDIAVDGSTDYLEVWSVPALTEEGNGKWGLDSGLAYEWRQEKPEEKVWIVNAAVGGTYISEWVPGGGRFDNATEVFSAAQAVLDAEVTAGHYEMKHMGYFWLQGEGDCTCTAEEYVNAYETMHKGLKEQLRCMIGGEEKGLEFGNILLVRALDYNVDFAGNGGYRRGSYAGYDNNNTFSAGTGYRDLEMTGPRVAQYYMANSNNPVFSDVNLVCDIGDLWVYDTNARADNLKNYFRNAYPNGVFDYPIQNGTLSMPSKPEDVHSILHYFQAGYNELGREAARNTISIIEGESAAPEVDFAIWNGFESVGDGNTVSVGTESSSDSLLVPRVKPVYMSKKVSYSVSPEVSTSYYDYYLKDDPEEGVMPGTLKAIYNGETIAEIQLEDSRTPTMMSAKKAQEIILKGDTVYYGNHASEPIPWNVLSPTLANGDVNTLNRAGLWLLTADSWGGMRYDKSPWSGSSGQTWCTGFFDSKFSAAEKAAILGISVTDSGTFDAVNGTGSGNVDKVYLLSLYEAKETSSVILHNGTDFWLRSTYKDDGTTDWLGQYWNSEEDNYSDTLETVPLPYDPDDEGAACIEARPATNLNYSMITFVSQADETKGKGKGAGNEGIDVIRNSSSCRSWKVTLTSSDLSGLAVDNVSISETGKLTADFTYSQAGSVIKANQISILVRDSKSNIKYYGKIADLDAQDTQSGTISIDNFTELKKEGSLFVFAEQRNGSCRTDYSGKFISLRENSVIDEPSTGGVGGSASSTSKVETVYAAYYVKSFKVAKARKAFVAKWKKQSKANQKKFSGYQIRYSRQADMSDAKYATAGKKSKSKKIKGLKAKTKYYVQVRTFTKSDGTTLYSKWSARKKVKTK